MVTPLQNSVLAALQRDPPPVLTDYALGRLVFLATPRPAGSPGRSALDYTEVLHFLRDQKITRNIGGLPEGRAMLLIGQSNPDPFVMLCAVDPFGYVSHLSAMEYHGLTDRLSKTLYFTTPPAPEWTQLASARMQKDLRNELDAYLEARFPTLRRLQIKRLDRRPIEYHHRRVAGGYRLADHGNVRVSSLGRTYLEMLQAPERCGGLQHVLDIFRAHAKEHLPLILSEFDRHGTEIDRARAGYILEDIANLRDPKLDDWQQRIQRGGSRKLYSRADYSPRYSERWAISLNHE